MTELRVFKISDRKSQTLDKFDQPIFTTIHEIHLFHYNITTIYRGSEDAGNVLAVFKGDKVTLNGKEEKQKEMIHSNGTGGGPTRTFFTPQGEKMKWKSVSQQWQLVPVSKPRPIQPLLTYYAPRRSVRKLTSNTWLGHSLKTILKISPNALSENSGYALLGNGGVPTPLLELAMVVLVIVMRREESGGRGAEFAGGGGRGRGLR
ncbi:hypothetical protein EPUS_09255 [Endocarpon pusillum Z07020]|uniref:DUF6593 domain-containing protein n=1 Tax=Endocarpon pusillum (strain Z07020 / HMAS-L-300199) TaxID=1263415 RepID=U1HWK9_ENDPU|nr:uncharacterized protein EPUS_09255 [Endocarpon pusillum Z07020]ERF73789.1 hypothetical protein EPUS_09255 [Endocarpon pusillum Z07020]